MRSHRSGGGARRATFREPAKCTLNGASGCSKGADATGKGGIGAADTTGKGGLGAADTTGKGGIGAADATGASSCGAAWVPAAAAGADTGAAAPSAAGA